MDRRAFLITTGGAAVAAASASGAEGAAADAHAGLPAGQQGTVLRLAMPWPDTPQGAGEGARRLARRIEVMTEGRYRIEIEAARTRADDTDLFHGTAHDLAALHPAFSYFAGLPGSSGLGASDLAHWIGVGGGQMLWDDLAHRHGWKPLLAGHLGEAPPLWSRTRIAGLGDLAGLRVAVAGLGADVARGLGADARVLAPGACALELEQRTVDGVEVGGALASLASGVARHARYATGTGLNGHGTALALHVRLPVWEGFSEADRAIFAAAAAEELQVSLAEERAHERIARHVLAASFSVTFAPWPADVAEALDRVAEATIAHVAGHDDLAMRIDQSYMAFRSAISGSPPPLRLAAAV